MEQCGAIIHLALNKYNRRFYPNSTRCLSMTKRRFIHGRIRAQLAAQGMPIGPYDSQIVAISLAHNLTLVTNNTREFCRVENLKVENWQAV